MSLPCLLVLKIDMSRNASFQRKRSTADARKHRGRTRRVLHVNSSFYTAKNAPGYDKQTPRGMAVARPRSRGSAAAGFSLQMWASLIYHRLHLLAESRKAIVGELLSGQMLGVWVDWESEALQAL